MFALSNDINEFPASVSSYLEPLPKAEPYPEVDYSPFPDELIISLEPTTKQLLQLKTCQGIGPDCIPNYVLKDFIADIIAGPLCAIQNSSMREEFIPELWKSANVTSLPKIVPRKDIKKDVCPISLTPVMSKLMKYHPVKAVNKICDSVYSSQYGCAEGTSTTHALISITQSVYIYKATGDSKNFGRFNLVDFSKAFDHIHHENALKKWNLTESPLCCSTGLLLSYVTENSVSKLGK